jgi:hypothetical protein
MRTNVLSRTTRLAAVTGLALAASTAGLATTANAAGPATTGTPAPTASSSPAPTTPPTPKPPVKPPLPAAGPLDANIAIVASNPYKPGQIGTVKIKVRSTVATDTYRFTVRTPKTLPGFEIPKHDGWDCKLTTQVDCDYTGLASKAPGEVWIAYSVPKAPGEAYVVNAKLQVTETDTDPSNNGANEIVQAAGKRVGTGVVAGKVWHDVNRDGFQDASEKGVAGARLTLHFGIGDDVVVGHATTGADGRYRFTKLPPGANDSAYSLTVNAPNKTWQFTTYHAGPNPNVDSDIKPDVRNPQQGYSGRLAVANGKTTVVDAGLTNDNKATGTIAGRVWHDANGNGRQDKGEKAVAGARLVVNIAVGQKVKVIGRATTGADGRYSFTRLPVGYSRYGVSIATPGKNWTFTEPGKGAEVGDSDILPENFNNATRNPLFISWFGKGAIVGFHDRTDVVARKTTVLDAGLIKHGGGSGTTGGGTTEGGTLPKTGAAVGGILGAGVLLLGGGVALTLLARRRRTATA